MKELKEGKNIISKAKVILPQDLVFEKRKTDFYEIEAVEKGADIIYHINPLKKLDYPVWFRMVNRVIDCVIMKQIIPPVFFPHDVTIDRLPNLFNSAALTIKKLKYNLNWKDIHNKIMDALVKEFAVFDRQVNDYISPRLNQDMLDAEMRWRKP